MASRFMITEFSLHFRGPILRLGFNVESSEKTVSREQASIQEVSVSRDAEEVDWIPQLFFSQRNR